MQRITAPTDGKVHEVRVRIPGGHCDLPDVPPTRVFAVAARAAVTLARCLRDGCPSAVAAGVRETCEYLGADVRGCVVEVMVVAPLGWFSGWEPVASFPVRDPVFARVPAGR